MRIAGVALGQLAPVTQDVTASSLVSGNWSTGATLLAMAGAFLIAYLLTSPELVDEHGRTVKTEKYRPKAKS